MRKFRPALSIVASVAMLAAFCATMVAQEEKKKAQNRERFVISAKAGGINAVSGKVMVQRRASTHSSPLTINDNLEQGEMVMTGTDGRVEVLLNPGSYMRVAENAEFEFTDTSLDGLQVKLTKGSAIVEASGIDDIKFQISVATPQTKVAIAKRGIYRINVLSGGLTEVMVFKGRALIGDDQSTLVKDGKKIVVGDSNTEVAKFDKKNRDTFDLWSRERAGTLAKANQRLSRHTFNSAFASFDNGYWPTNSFSRRGGIWLYNPELSCYTFAPFNVGWSSPYGLDYSNYFSRVGNMCHGCPSSTQAYRPNPSGNNPNPGGGGSTTTPPPDSDSPDNPPRPDGRRHGENDPVDHPRGDRPDIERRSPDMSDRGPRESPQPVPEPQSYTPPPAPPSSPPSVESHPRQEMRAENPNNP